MEFQKYKVNVSDWTEVGLENAKFILAEAQSYVKYLSDVSGKITARAYSILTVLAPITSALIAFLVKQSLDGNIQSKFITFYTLIIVVIQIIVMFVLGKIVMPRVFMPVGRSPIEISDDEMLGVTFDKKLSLIALTLNEIENCQTKIQFNEQQNSERKELLNLCMKTIGVSFALATFTVTIYLCFTLF